MTLITLTSSDGTSFKVEKSLIILSETIKNILSDMDDGEDITIPLPNVEGKYVPYIIEYLKLRENNPLSEEEKMKYEKTPKHEQRTIVKPWEKDFVKELDDETLSGLILASSYLDILDLRMLLCKTVATIITDSSEEQVRERFGIKDDLTEEEKKKIMEDLVNFEK